MEPPLMFCFSCQGLHLNRETVFERQGLRAELMHRPGEPDSALRLSIACDDLSLELLPSKGLSLGGVFYGDRPVFWDPPAGLPDPDRLDLTSDEIMIEGKAARGFTYLKTFMAGIELYGLRNWGMPRVDSPTGELHPLHGETSNIPVKEVTGVIYPDHMEVQASFVYRRFHGDSEVPWHESGDPTYQVTRMLVIPRENKSIELIDRIANITADVLIPDWGYHITFRPENGSKLMVPSQSLENRSGREVPADCETWRPAQSDEVRSEIGIIHKRLKVYEPAAARQNKVLMAYPAGRGIALSFPPSPYFQTWFCSGGANSKEFTDARTGKPVLFKNWDGQGIEIGSSPLDHDGNIDASVDYKEALEPGEVLENRIKIEMLTKEQAKTLLDEIQQYNRSYRKMSSG